MGNRPPDEGCREETNHGQHRVRVAEESDSSQVKPQEKELEDQDWDDVENTGPCRRERVEQSAPDADRGHKGNERGNARIEGARAAG